MSDNDNGNGNGKKKKAVDWKGIATLVTAIGGVLGMFLIQDKGGNEQNKKIHVNDMIQESSHTLTNKRIDHLERRLGRIEGLLMRRAMMESRMKDMMVHGPPRSECDTDSDCDVGYSCMNERCQASPMSTPIVRVDIEPLKLIDPEPEPDPELETMLSEDEVIERFRDYKEIKQHVQMEQAPVRIQK